jgi:uncharacterized protein YlaN (UPF0358 family)
MSHQVPNAERAIIDVAKLRAYSLNPAHEKGKHKARVFESALGFTEADAERLRQLIKAAIMHNQAVPGAPSPYGQRFVVDFQTPGLQGMVTVRSAWMIRSDEDFPRLTTCYIVRSKDGDD